MELQRYLVCNDHPGKLCYKLQSIGGESRSTDHINMDPTAIRDWTTAILAESATIKCPPRTREFDQYLNPRQRSKSISTSIATPTAAPVHVYLGRHQRDHSYSPRTPRHGRSHSLHTPRRRHSPYERHTTPHTTPHATPFSSPLVAHESFQQFGGDGLATFMHWCECEYKVSATNMEFKEASQVLEAGNIGVDILQGKNAAWFQKQGLKAGTADRIARSYPKWRAQLGPQR